MRRSIWSLVLCAGVGAAALVGTRAVEADRPSVEERQPAAPACTSDATHDAVELMCGKCGDHYCSASCGETAASCPKDCGTPS